MLSAQPSEHSQSRIDEAFERAFSFDGDDVVQADYARYLCVLVTGFLEQQVQQTILSYVDSQDDRRLSSYIAARLRRSRNMRRSQLLELVGEFDLAWRSELLQRLTDAHSAAIESAYASRNSIAHGEDVALTLSQIREYYRFIREVVEFFRHIVRVA